MVHGIGKVGMGEVQQNQVNNPAVNAGAVGAGGTPSHELDAKESATAPKFGELYKQIQAKYGEKAQKPREIKKTLGKDDFLHIMITQMKNQDPTNPFKAEQMATEIAQFTSVEQLQNVNQNLAKLANQNKPLEQMVMTNLIGKMVTIDRERFPHLEGQTDSLEFILPRDGATVNVSIVGENGEVVLQKELGGQKAGQVIFNWDGIKSNSLPAKGGNYVFRVDAKDDHGKVVETNPRTQARVIGVTFEGSEPVFLVGDASHQDKVTLKSIIQIEQDIGQLSSKMNAQPSPSVAPKSPNYFEFKRGQGSSPLQSQPPIPSQAGAESRAVPQNLVAPEEKGFPNGLHELDPIQSEPKVNLQNLSQNNVKGGDAR